MFKKLQIAAIILAFAAMAIAPALAQNTVAYDMSTKEKIKENLPKLMGSSNQGSEFWLTFHPAHESSGFDNQVKLYVTSDVATKVTLEIPGRQKIMSKITIPDDIIEFSLPPNEAQCYTKEIGDPPYAQRVFRGYGLHITAEDPIVIYGVSRYSLTTDGFLAIPLSGYGTEYVVHSWGDYTVDNGNEYYTSYLSVVAAYDNTQVEVTLGGNPVNYTPKPNQMFTGDHKKNKMNAGDVWLIGVMGDYSDLTGSYIEADKPVSVISGNFRTTIPATYASRDYLIEHMMPLHTWGNKYHVTPIEGRLYASFIRVFAGEEDAIIYRDGDPWAKVPHVGGEETQGYISQRAVNNEQDPAKPPVVISSDKRITVAQYNPTTGDDGQTSDPFMMHLTPIEQYQTKIVFCTPGISEAPAFPINYMNLCYKATKDGLMPTDIEYGMPQNGTVNWVPFNTVVTNAGEEFFDEEITDGRPYKAVTFSLPDPAGVYALRSETPFAAYGYGFDAADSYGYPLAAALRDLSVPDTWKPEAEYTMTCEGYVEGIATEQPAADSLRSNFQDLFIVQEESYNYEFDWIDKDDFVQGVTREIEFIIEPKDKEDDMRAVLNMVDRAGNYDIVVFDYKATKFNINPRINLWPQAAYNDPPQPKKVTVVNETDQAVVIDSVLLYSSDANVKYDYSGFTIDNSIYAENGGFLPGYTMQPGESFEVTVTFDPMTVKDDIDAGKTNFLDSVGVKAYWSDDENRYCYYHYLASLKASTGTPQITAGDHTFPAVTVNTNEPPSANIIVENPGTSNLTIESLSGPNGESEGIYIHNMDEFPMVLSPQERREVTITFKPNAVGMFPDTIYYHSDADPNAVENGGVYKPYTLLNGEGIIPGVSITGYDWKERRVHFESYNDAGNEHGNEMFPYPVDDAAMNMKIRNTGSQEFKITYIGILDNAPESFKDDTQKDYESLHPEAFKLDVNGDNVYDELKDGDFVDDLKQINVSGGRDVKAGEELIYSVFFDPKTIGEHYTQVIVIGEIDGQEVYDIAEFRGIGIRPEVATVDTIITYNYNKAPGVPEYTAIVGDTENPYFEVEIPVTNTASDEYADDLTIYDVRVVDGEGNAISTDISTGGDLMFAYDKAGITAAGYPTVAPGETYTFKARYWPTASSDNNGKDFNIAHVNVITDAESYETPSEWRAKSITQNTSLVGDELVDCIGYDNLLEPTITNTGDDEIEITDIQLIPNDGNYEVISSKNFSLAPGQTETVQVSYTSTSTASGTPPQVTFITDILATNSLTDHEPQVEVKGASIKNDRRTIIELDGDNNHSFYRANKDTIDLGRVPINPTMPSPLMISFEKDEKQTFEYAVVVGEGDLDMLELTDAEKSDITVDITYNRNYLGPREFDNETKNVGVELGDDLEQIGGFEILSAIELGSNNDTEEEMMTTIRVEIRTEHSLDVLPIGEFELLKLDFRFSMSEALLVMNDGQRKRGMYHDITVKDACLTMASDTAWVSFNPICAENLTLVEIVSDEGGMIEFGMDDINPNPVNASGADLNYSLGFECLTNIRIINAAGDVVATPVAETKAAGAHAVAIPVNELSSGVYFIELQAGPYRETKQLVIEK
jgi:hypothetical protein